MRFDENRNDRTVNETKKNGSYGFSCSSRRLIGHKELLNGDLLRSPNEGIETSTRYFLFFYFRRRKSETVPRDRSEDYFKFHVFLLRSHFTNNDYVRRVRVLRFKHNPASFFFVNILYRFCIIARSSVRNDRRISFSFYEHDFTRRVIKRKKKKQQSRIHVCVRLQKL